MKFLFLLLLVSLSIFTFGQREPILKNEFPDVLPKKYKLDAEKEIANFFIDKSELQQDKDYLDYITNLKFDLATTVENAVIAKNTALEDYLNAILRKLVPEDTIKKYRLTIYVTNEEGFNAGATDDGSIFFNIYNFIYLNNEAELAFILAHEVSHVFHRDGYKLSKLYTAYTNSNPRALINHKQIMLEKESQKFEAEADRLACELIRNSPYNTLGGISVMEVFKRQEKRAEFIKGAIRRKGIYLDTHPLSQKRIDSLTVWLGASIGKDYVVDEQLFLQVKEEVVSYILTFHFDCHQYLACIELALEDYFVNKNDENLYYILESIRRVVYLYPNLSNKPLLGELYKVTQSSGIAHNYKIIFPKDFDQQIINDLVSKGVVTYDEFFDYFKEIALTKNIPECVFSIGMKTYSPSKENYLIKQYLDYPNVKYREFAQYLLNETEFNTTNGKEILVYNELHYSAYNYYGFPIDDWKYSDSLNDQINSYVYRKYQQIRPNDSLINMAELKKTSFNEYYKLKNFYQYYRMLEDNEIMVKTPRSLYLLNPELWLYMKENNYSRFDIIDLFRCKSGHGFARYMIGIYAGISDPLWTYYITIYTLNQKDKKFNYTAYEVGTTIKKKHTFGVLSYYVFSKKNFPKK